jgi:hypothetical protein
VIFVVGLSHSISTGFAGFWGGFPFMMIIIVVLAWRSTTSGMNACAGTGNDGQAKALDHAKLSDATLERAARDYDAIINMDDGLSRRRAGRHERKGRCHHSPVTRNISQPRSPRGSTRA